MDPSGLSGAMPPTLDVETSSETGDGVMGAGGDAVDIMFFTGSVVLKKLAVSGKGFVLHHGYISLPNECTRTIDIMCTICFIAKHLSIAPNVVQDTRT